MAVNRRGQVRCWRVETYQVEGIGGLSAYLQRESFDADIAKDPQINIPITRCTKIVARGVAIRAVRADAEARAVGCERGGIEPLGGSSSAASVWIQECLLPRNQVRPVVVGAVKVLVGTSDDVDRRAAVEGDDGRYRPVIRELAHEGVRALVVIDIPNAGDASCMAPIIVRRASFFPQIGKILGGGQPDSRFI